MPQTAPISYTSAEKAKKPLSLPTLRLAQNDGEMIKAQELIKVVGAESLTLGSCPIAWCNS